MEVHATHYRGRRDDDNVCYLEKLVAGSWLAVPDRSDVKRHGQPFEWGRSTGDGASRTALALLCDLTGDDELALAIAPIFRRRVLTGFTRQWQTSATKLMRDVNELKRKAGVHNQACERCV